jgi:hypothetical protein
VCQLSGEQGLQNMGKILWKGGKVNSQKADALQMRPSAFLFAENARLLMARL